MPESGPLAGENRFIRLGRGTVSVFPPPGREAEGNGGTDGAAACKAQALFIRKHGKEAFFRVQDALHTLYDFEKTQQLLGQSVAGGLKILEDCLASLERE